MSSQTKTQLPANRSILAFLFAVMLVSFIGCVPAATSVVAPTREPASTDAPLSIEDAVPIAGVPLSTDRPVPADNPVSKDAPQSTDSEELIVVVACPSPFREALKPWVRRRQREGLGVEVIDSEPTAGELKKSLAKIATSKCRYVLLVGDSQLTAHGEAVDPERYVPTIYQDADVTAAYQQTPQIPGDVTYGNFEESFLQAAVGRLPVKSPEQLTAFINRIFAYEDSKDFGPWRSRVDLVAGIGGFGPMIDGAIEMVASGIITGGLPQSIRTRITHASPTSDFHPGIDNFTPTVLSNYADGARFWVYAGHGWVNELDRVPSTQFGRPVLAMNDLPQLKRSHSSPPIALMLACYTGAFDLNEDCISERMLLSDEGPIAVLAGSRVTMPYGNAAAAMGLIHSVYNGKSDRLGDTWREALSEMATTASEGTELASRRMMVDGIASLLGGGARIDDERREHMQLYNLLGDPTLRLRAEQKVTVDELNEAFVGIPIVVKGESPLGGKLVVEVHRRLGTRPTANDADVDGYQAANDTTLGTTEKDIQSGQWECEVVLQDNPQKETPSTLPIIVKVSVVSENDFASGATTGWLRKPK